MGNWYAQELLSTVTELRESTRIMADRIAELERQCGEMSARIETDGKLIAELERERDSAQESAERSKQSQIASQDRITELEEVVKAARVVVAHRDEVTPVSALHLALVKLDGSG